jgi:hypothetical protein
MTCSDAVAKRQAVQRSSPRAVATTELWTGDDGACNGVVPRDGGDDE